MSGKENLFQSLGLAFYLAGMATGSFLNSKSTASFKRLLSYEVGNLLVGSFFLVFLYLHLGYGISSNFNAPVSPEDLPQFPLFLWGLGGVFLIGSFTGAELPEFLKFKPLEKNKVLFLNYFGALFSGIFLNFLLGHSFDTKQVLLIFTIMVGVNFLTLIMLSRKWILVLSIFLLPLTFSLSVRLGEKIEKAFLASYYLGTKVDGFREFIRLAETSSKIGLIENIKTPFQDLHLVTELPVRGSATKGNISLYLNYRPQFDLYSYTTYHESMVAGALNLSQMVPRKVLILGGGDGILLNVIKKFLPETKVTLIELDPVMLNIFKNNSNLLHFNDDVFNSGFGTVVQDDAFAFIKEDNNKYDAIFIDFPYPYSDELTSLYSAEFFKTLKRNMNSGGFFIVDFPVTDGENFSLLYLKLEKTLKVAGIETVFPFGPYSSFVYGKLKKETVSFSYEKMPEDIHLSTSLNLFGLSHLERGEKSVKSFSLFYEQ